MAKPALAKRSSGFGKPISAENVAAAFLDFGPFAHELPFLPRLLQRTDLKIGH